MRRTMALAATFAFVVALPTMRAAAADCEGIDAKIAAAKTAADHDAIAGCYDEMAKAARAKASTHERMAAAYRAGGGAPAVKLQLPQHCKYLTNTFELEAEMLEQMAAGHREMAKSAK